MINKDQVARLLEKEEGNVLHVYTDHLGYLTLGVGRLVDVRKGGGISKEESRYLLNNDMDKFHIECGHRFPWFCDLDQARQQVIVCMAFQLGTDGVAKFSNMISCIKRKDFMKAAQEMIDSKWNEDTPQRCARMASIMIRGEWHE